MDKILFICEGSHTEKKFCKLIIEKYFIQNERKKEYVAFGTNIYGLYDELSKDYGLDIVELIKEKAKKKNNMVNYSKLNSGGFSEIYLIFDFDPQAPQYDENKIKRMVKYFDNETENGKLYINYPMMESLKNFKSIPDLDYNNYVINKNMCSSYKEYVSKISCINHFNDITNDILKVIIKQNLLKYEKISDNFIRDYESYVILFSQDKLLSLQILKLNTSSQIYVINTSIFFGIDYFGKNKYLEYMNDND